MRPRIVVIDYDLGNLRSVQKAFERLDCNVIISRDENDLNGADKLVLSGVGHFLNGMLNLRKFGLIEQLNKLVVEKQKPILGICLGMQLMTKFSEEGNIEGLGWINADTVLLKKESLSNNLKIPHMGWNTINSKSRHKILENITSDDEFYFVHSYSVKCHEKKYSLCTSAYGIDFDSGIERENIIGVQFHPEKSHKVGMRLLENFIKL